MKTSGNLSRRHFLATTASAGLCLCGLNGCNFLLPSVGDTPRLQSSDYEIATSNGLTEILIDIGKTPDLLKEGSAVKIIDDRIRDRIIVANAGKDGFIARSIACTHNGAEVEYHHDRKIFKCVSFNRAEFSQEGRSVDRMDLKPLTTYSLRRQGDKWILSL